MSYLVVLGSIFVVHMLALISPGPNVLIVTQMAVSQTRRVGIATALGLATGAAVWSSTALIGLNVVFVRLAWLYDGLRILGGVYLIYLGIMMWRTTTQPLVPSSSEELAIRTDWQAFRRGLQTNLTNPKAALFFSSIFTAFLTPSLPTWVKLASVGIIIADATIFYVAMAYFFSTRQVQQVYQRSKHWVNRIAGTILALVGLRLIRS